MKMNGYNLLAKLYETGDIEGARMVEKLLSDCNNAIQYVPHTCKTCRYWELSQDPKRMYSCTHPDRENPCYVWRTQNWEWNGKPPEPDICNLWQLQ